MEKEKPFRDALNVLFDEMEKKVIQHKKDDVPLDYYDMTRRLLSFELPGKCPFKVGDFVTPKETANIKNPGVPCLVIMVFESVQLQPGNPSGPLEPYNMILARADFCDEVLLFLTDSRDYEPYTGLKYGDAGELEEPGI